ncbi:MAG: GH3 auxin-responsive promoter family protein [Sphingobacteriaceae bacterium]|nr:GH3 auxin-responsive promoter family protein [Sphingobacteriaceae bacterium]
MKKECIKQYSLNIQLIQSEWLSSLLKDASKPEYFKKYSFAHISSWHEFKNKVPVVNM